LQDWLLLTIGIISGLVIGYLMLHKLFHAHYRVKLERWKIETEKVIRNSVLEKSRASLKGRIGEQMAPLLPFFDFEASDARFLGNPVDYIIFENYTQVKDRGSSEPVTITFLEVKTGKKKSLTTMEKMIREAVEARRVRWKTLLIEQ
jgi:predicted Holliday junction resolvase-like endonuclease